MDADKQKVNTSILNSFDMGDFDYTEFGKEVAALLLSEFIGNTTGDGGLSGNKSFYVNVQVTAQTGSGETGAADAAAGAEVAAQVPLGPILNKLCLCYNNTCAGWC